jgi:hypothetical protein
LIAQLSLRLYNPGLLKFSKFILKIRIVFKELLKILITAYFSAEKNQPIFINKSNFNLLVKVKPASLNSSP